MTQEERLKEMMAAIDELLQIADLRVDRTKPYKGFGQFMHHPLRSEQGPPAF